jgi:hypothetical protein
MSQLPVALLLLVVVISVSAATRPAPPRRRRGRSRRPRAHNALGPSGSRRHRTPVLLGRRARPLPTADPINRNHWDRTDITTGVGRDHADPDLTLSLWPEPR